MLLIGFFFAFMMLGSVAYLWVGGGGGGEGLKLPQGNQGCSGGGLDVNARAGHVQVRNKH